MLYGWGETARQYTDDYKNEFSTVTFVERPRFNVYQDRDNDLDEWVSGRLVQECLRIKKDFPNIDTVLVDYVWLSKILTLFPSSHLKILNVHDMFSNRRNLLVKGCGRNSWFSLGSSQESSGLNRSNVAIFISTHDLEAANKIRGGANTFKGLVSSTENSLGKTDLSKEKILESVGTPQNTLILGYVASSNDLNKASATRLFSALDKLIRTSEPSRPYEINVYGNICKHLPETTCTKLFKKGCIEDIATVYSRSHILLAPMIENTGMNVKVMEAIDNGLPILATAYASRGTRLTGALGNIDNIELMAGLMAGFLMSTATSQRALCDLLIRRSISARSQNSKIRESFRQEVKAFIDHHRKGLAKAEMPPCNSEPFVAVSIIIPAFNTSEYIRGCISSIQNDSLKNIEIIIVDDFSSDETYLICQEIEAVDDRVKLLRLDQNSGQAKARNLGLDLARGKYVYFVDSDDQIKSNSLRDMFMLSESNSLDICFINRPAFNLCDYSRISCFGAWQAMISRALIESGKPLRQPIVKSGQDGIFANMCVTRSQALGTCQTADYIYNKRPDSTFSKAQNDISGLVPLVEKQIYCLRQFYVESGLFPSLAHKYLLFLHDETYRLRYKPVKERLSSQDQEKLNYLLQAEIIYHGGQKTLEPYLNSLDENFVAEFL